MIQALFSVIINLIGTVIQIVALPVNAVITSTLPDLSDKILSVTNTLNTAFDSISWALGLIPGSVIATIVFIITIEIAKHTIFVSTHNLLKVWNLFQKIKFW